MYTCSFYVLCVHVYTCVHVIYSTNEKDCKEEECEDRERLGSHLHKVQPAFATCSDFSLNLEPYWKILTKSLRFTIPMSWRDNPSVFLLGQFCSSLPFRDFDSCIRLSDTLIFPYLIRGGKPTLLYSWAMAFVFCTYNGYLQSRYLSQYAVYADDWVTQPRFLTGFALWLLGMLINIHSDHILRNLRKPGEIGYRIPRGGLFEYVSGANYFGETVEWCGFALASWSLQGGAFALFTFCILLARANNHHQWYLEKFEDYPKFRKIIIPFLL
uniref:3-oxo-5alpha-steroid 4-dehydrogenase (NADP(+)) n=1 Tax=Marmota marmota marmota TaxID=9994 RepID=A0A8C5ZRF6_MARMA